jgi:tetratricopeptide (TPR) repeat protein
LVFLVCFRLISRVPNPQPEDRSSPTQAFALPIAFLTALLFGFHPIHVESVAWATERKDVLYSLFYLGALYVYLGRSPHWEWKGFKVRACLALYLLSLMSKPMAVTLPFIFLIFDYYPLGRWDKGWIKLFKEKALFLLLALGSAWVTMVSHVKALSYANKGLEFYWLLNAFRSFVFYPLKMAWPNGLTAYYPFPPHVTGLYLAENIGSMLVVILVSYLFFRYRAKVPYLLTAWLFYVVILLPVMGVVQTGSEAAADRFTYISSLGFFLPFSCGLAWLLSYHRYYFLIPTLLLTAGMTWATQSQIETWRNSQSLWEKVTQTYPEENSTAYNNLGATYIKAHRYLEALEAYSKAAAIPPPLAASFNGLGTAYLYNNMLPDAEKTFKYSLTLDPQFTLPRVNLWTLYEHQGKHAEAAEQMREALKVMPYSPEYHDNLGVSDCFLNNYEGARVEFDQAHRLAPDQTDYLVNLATVYQWEKKTDQALDLYRQGIRHNPKEPVYYLKMADLYLSRGEKEKALERLDKAWSLGPKSPKVLKQMGEDYQQAGQTDKANRCQEKARSLTENSGA